MKHESITTGGGNSGEIEITAEEWTKIRREMLRTMGLPYAGMVGGYWDDPKPKSEPSK